MKRNDSHALQMLSIWSLKFPFQLITKVGDMFDNPNQVTTEWYKESGGRYFVLIRMNCAGSYSNEEVIKYLLRNIDFKTKAYEQWNAGNIYTFKLYPDEYGYLKLSKYCIQHGQDREFVYNKKHLYDWLNISNGVKYIRRKLQ